MQAQLTPGAHYADVNGLHLYYEIHGQGQPLVLLHGGGSTIETTYGRVLPDLAKDFLVIAVELQAHGHTKDIDRPLSFQQDADDVAELLRQLNVSRADFMGFSNGGTTCLQIAIRHPKLVRKLVLMSASYKLSGHIPGFFDGFDGVTVKDLPAPLAEGFLKANPDAAGLQAMFERDVARMKAYTDIPDTDIRNITAPALVINGNQDVITIDHALELSRTLQHGQLAILPGVHGAYIGEICTPVPDSQLPLLSVAMVKEFLGSR
ncbi:alpha/beta fold hydrolase [Chitinophaga jiangningensis]|nr:alpha/beta hydrolase [Chitinophaga jiangningensis]